MIHIVPVLPDIGWIRNEPRYFVQVRSKTDGKIRLVEEKLTKRQAMKLFKAKAEDGWQVRVARYGETPEGVKMLMPDASWNWKLTDAQIENAQAKQLKLELEQIPRQ